jgi:hypothetical protein
MALLQGVADFVDRIVLFAQTDDEAASRRLLGLGAGSGTGRNKEDGVRVTAEMVVEEVKVSDRVAEGTSDLFIVGGRLSRK